ncbi:MAG: FAD-dependent oxidoreductase [Planctomycetes bacterium]|nr:FAD-dependent oxidoreductase [Planctomycetota bacterium]
MKQRAIIIGGGFAGLAAAKRLKRELGKIEVLLIDKRTHHNFLPLLPDLVGRDFKEENLLYPLEHASQRFGFEFLNSRVKSIDLEEQKLTTVLDEIPFDFLVIATGSETDFYASVDIHKHAYTLESVDDAIKLRRALFEARGKNIVICGGGYTGVELASAVAMACRRHFLNNTITLVNIGQSLCTSLPWQFQKYISENLENLAINVKLGTTVSRAEKDVVQLENGEIIRNSLLIWVAGKTTSGIIQGLQVDKNRRGRLLVDPYLRIGKFIFAAGDVASFVHGAENLRMSVQFSLSQGHCAADNIARYLNGRPLVPFKAHDPGYVVPMANGLSCGKVMNRDLFGRLPTWLHYSMSAFRSYSPKNSYNVLRDWLSSSFHNPDKKFQINNLANKY